MKVDLVKILKELNSIRPNTEYSAYSKRVILSHEPIKQMGAFGVIKNFQSTRVMIAEIASVFTIVALIGGFWMYNINENKSALVVKADELNASINVKLNEIRYLLLLTETPLNKEKTTDFIKTLKLTEEVLKNADTELSDNKVDQSIDKIKSAEKMLLDIESYLKTLPRRSIDSK